MSASPLLMLIARRLSLGLCTLLLVSITIFVATEVLPGDAARVVLGRGANEITLHALRERMHLDAPVSLRYARWLRDFCFGDFGISLVNGEPVATLVVPRAINSVALLCLASLVGFPLAVGAGVLAAVRRGTSLDGVMCVLALVIAALPEFVVGMGLILCFATVVVQWLPPVSLVPPGISVLARPRILILPVTALVLVIFPYIFRMTRVTMIDVLASDYMEMATLKGVPNWRRIVVHALPNALSPTVQVLALTFAYLAGGTVMIEYLFGFAGLGQGLMNAIEARDIPLVQAIVLILASFYVLLNVAADVVSIVLTPKQRDIARWPAR